MNNQTKLLIVSLVIFMAFFQIVSCKKNTDVSAAMKDTTSVNKDTALTQDVYTIDSFSTPTPGIILATPYSLSIAATTASPGLLLMMDQSGHVLKKVTTPGAAFNFQRFIINGQTRYTYMVNDPSALRILKGEQEAGYAVITDSNLNEIRQVNFTPFGSNLFQNGQALDVHDFILLSDSNYITLSYINKYVNNIPSHLSPASSVPVFAPLIEEIHNGNVVWSWDGSADTSFYANSVEGNVFSDSLATQDYMHMNSMFIDPRDSNLICSMRNQDQVIKIDRKTGAVIWRLGGKNSDFALTPDQVFLRQHHATLTDNNQTLLIFDDGDDSLRASSRIVEFQLNEAGKTVTSFKSFNIPEPFSMLMGSVQKIGNEYFIGGGTGNYLLEVNYVTGQKVMEFKGSLYSYRAFKYQ